MGGEIVVNRQILLCQLHFQLLLIDHFQQEQGNQQRFIFRIFRENTVTF